MQEERKTIQTNLDFFHTGHLGIFFNGVEAREALRTFTAHIERKLETLEAKSADKCVFYLDTSCDEYGEEVVDGLTLKAERPETDEEVHQRLRARIRQKQRQEQAERQEHERLQKKYGAI